MSNPFAGIPPLNLRRDPEKLEKAVSIKDQTSYRPGITHPTEYRNQYLDDSFAQRNAGCTALRRYPNGRLDFEYVANQIIDLIHKVKDGGFLTDYEKSCLTLILPGKFGSLIDSKIAQTMTKLSTDERMMLGIMVDQHMREELNYNAGRGGGSVPGRSSSRG